MSEKEAIRTLIIKLTGVDVAHGNLGDYVAYGSKETVFDEKDGSIRQTDPKGISINNPNGGVSIVNRIEVGGPGASVDSFLLALVGGEKALTFADKINAEVILPVAIAKEAGLYKPGQAALENSGISVVEQDVPSRVIAWPPKPAEGKKQYAPVHNEGRQVKITFRDVESTTFLAVFAEALKPHVPEFAKREAAKREKAAAEPAVGA